MSTAPAAESTAETLSRNLSARHVRFIAIGSAIGTGLFYGSAGTIQAAGPSVLLAYLVAGLMVFFVMRSLGEMAVRYPTAGSFAQYANRFIHPLAGYVTGWIFALEMALVCIADMTAVAKYMSIWFPDVHGAVWMAAAIAVIGGLNLLKVEVFGELEFWFSLIKVSAIILLVVGGLVLIIGGISVGGTTPSFSSLWDHGFMPFGVWGTVMSLGIVVFSFGGIETLGMTAGEAGRPEKSMASAVNTVPFRILLFYVGALAVIMAIFPWTQVTGKTSPFVQVFEALKIPGASHVMTFVVLTAALSAMNAIFYSVSRMLYGLAEQGHAPRSFLKRTANGNVPIIPILIMFGVSIIGLVLFFAMPDRLFFFVAAVATFTTVFTWLMILISHWAMRNEMKRNGEAPSTFAAPLFPVANAVAIAFMLFVIYVLATSKDGRDAFLVGAAFLALFTATYFLFVKGKGRERLEMPLNEAALQR